VPSAADRQHAVTLANSVALALALAFAIAVHEHHPDEYDDYGRTFAVRVIVGIRYFFAVRLIYSVWVGFSVVIRSHVHRFRDAQRRHRGES
jgi:hypothetical protein